jgi:plasmid stability protein
MGQVLVRNLDDRVNESWKTKSNQGRSLEQLGQELRDVLTTSLTPEETVALFKNFRAMTPPIGDVGVRAAFRHGGDDEFDE